MISGALQVIAIEIALKARRFSGSIDNTKIMRLMLPMHSAFHSVWYNQVDRLKRSLFVERFSVSLTEWDLQKDFENAAGHSAVHSSVAIILVCKFNDIQFAYQISGIWNVESGDFSRVFFEQFLPKTFHWKLHHWKTKPFDDFLPITSHPSASREFNWIFASK